MKYITRNLNFFKLTPRTITKEQYKEQTKSITRAFRFKDFNNHKIHTEIGSIRLYGEPRVYDDFCLGTLCFNQTSNIPPSLPENSDYTEALDLGEDVGIAYSTCFMFDYKTNIIAIESNRPGVTIGQLLSLMRRNYDGLPIIDFNIIIKPDQYEKFLNSRSICKVSARIAKIQSGNILSNNKSTSEIFSFADRTNSNDFHFMLKSESKDRPLENVRDVITNLLSLKEEEKITELEITSLNENDQWEKYDLIKERLKERIRVEKVRLKTSFFIDDKYNEIQSKFGSHLNSLRQTYKNE